MRTLVKLVIAAMILNAAGRYGLSAWTHYNFRDSVQQTLLFGDNASPAELANEIMREAERQEVPLDPDELNVQQNGGVVTATATYVDRIELFPRYIYPKTWEFDIEVRHLNTAGLTGRTRRKSGS